MTRTRRWLIAAGFAALWFILACWHTGQLFGEHFAEYRRLAVAR